MKENKLQCSECGTVIEDNYFQCLDNCLQVNFFDTEEENCFCSQECFCNYMSLKEIPKLTEDEEKFVNMIKGNEKI